jgi:hypothetical protein
MVGQETAVALKGAGVDQALLDVVGAEETWRRVLHLEEGEALMRRSLDALFDAGLEVVPHVIAGLHFGRILGERRALEILRGYPSRLLVWVTLMPLSRTPLAKAVPPAPEEAARLLAESRLMFPDTEISLGCARPRGTYRRILERLALAAGVNRMALYSEETIASAAALGLEMRFQESCCSLAGQPVTGQETAHGGRVLDGRD